MPVRLALIESGTQGDAFLKAASRLRGGMIRAIVDSLPDRAQELARKLQAPIWTTSARELHEQHDSEFDAWVTPTSHGLLIVPQNQRPLQTDSERWGDLPAGWSWGHPFRFLPSIRTIRDSLNSGTLGAPGHVRIHHWRSRETNDVRQSMLQQLDIACLLIGQPPTHVFAQQVTPPGQAAVPGYLQVHLGFADDRMALIDCCISEAVTDEYHSLSVIGSTGAAYADDHHNQQLLFQPAGTRAVRTEQSAGVIRDILQEFINATAADRPPECGAAEWSRARQLLAAVDRSLMTRDSVLTREVTP